MRIYLAGPITDGIDHEYRGNPIPEGCVAYHPLEQYDTDEQTVRMDYFAITRCDIMVALVSRPAWGVAMEIKFAWEQYIPVIGYWPNYQGEPRSPWLMHHLACFADKWDAVHMMLKKYRDV